MDLGSEACGRGISPANRVQNVEVLDLDLSREVVAQGGVAPAHPDGRHHELIEIVEH